MFTVRQFDVLAHNYKMLAQIPRKPIFPEHMIAKEMRRIEKDVQDDVIPVSAGIYSEHKLLERLQAIPKPDVVDYQDPIFYDTIDVSKFPCKTPACPLCGQQYGTKKNMAIQCNFCGVWSCDGCMCPRKRYHPRAKQSNSERFSICYKCDDKFLSLTLNHGFVESKALLQEIMRRVRKQKDEFEEQCEKRQGDQNYARDALHKNKFKISSIKKEQVDLKKTINKLQTQRQDQTMKLRVREKYLAILLKKKEAMKQKNEQRMSLQLNQTKQSEVSAKPVRSLSHSNVYSESIKTTSEGHKQQKQSIKETSYTRYDESIYSPPEEKAIEPPKQEKVENFYNYNQWGSEQKGVVVQLNDQMEEQQEVIKRQAPSPRKIDLQKQVEIQIHSQSELPSQQKMAKIAQIFSKPEPVIQQEEYSSQDEAQSLDGEVIKMRKAALMRAAIQQSHKSRIQMDTEMMETDLKKCSCIIY